MLSYASLAVCGLGDIGSMLSDLVIFRSQGATPWGSMSMDGKAEICLRANELGGWYRSRRLDPVGIERVAVREGRDGSTYSSPDRERLRRSVVLASSLAVSSRRFREASYLALGE
jgi:hypothetical protein